MSKEEMELLVSACRVVRDEMSAGTESVVVPRWELAVVLDAAMTLVEREQGRME
jgi:hypothetical protein